MTNKIFIIFFTILILPTLLFSEEAKWKKQTSSHFIIFYKDAPIDFIDEVFDAAEDYYYEITRELGFIRYRYWLWEERAKIYIYSDADDYHKSTAKSTWASGHSDYKAKTIYTYPLAWGFFDTLLPHELGHIIFREFVGYKNKAIPLWLDEGVASYQEKARRWGADKLVKKAIDENKFIPLDKLSEIKDLDTLDKNAVELFYNEAVSVVYFLITKYGRYNFMNFCKALRDGQKIDKAIDSAYPRFEDLRELNSVWYEYLKKQ
jgi:hypothetical protein